MNEQQPLILVVDDDRLVLATLVAGLKQAGFEVIEADNGDDGILLARKYKPRLAILDMRMQGKSGMDVARYLAANTGTGFMFLSAFGDADIVEEATPRGGAWLPGQAARCAPDRPGSARGAGALGRAAIDADSAQPMAMAHPGRDEYIAVGILMERLAPRFERALDALRSQARAEGTTPAQLASNMVVAANRLNSIPRSPYERD